MNKDALFADGTSDYVTPAQPQENEKVTLRFRTAEDDVDEVRILPETETRTMRKAYTRSGFDFYETQWQLGERPFRYSFEIVQSGDRCV